MYIAYICIVVKNDLNYLKHPIMNRLTLKALLLSTITELKFGSPLAKNSLIAKRQYKKLAGLAKNANNKKVLNALELTYKDNDLEAEFLAIINKFDAKKYLA